VAVFLLLAKEVKMKTIDPLSIKLIPVKTVPELTYPAGAYRGKLRAFMASDNTVVRIEGVTTQKASSGFLAAIIKEKLQGRVWVRVRDKQVYLVKKAYYEATETA
jgi:hypothetical protein